jgi:hypothetical protein
MERSDMMDYATESANRKRDARLRRRILATLHSARAMSPRGGISARMLRDTVDSIVPDGQSFEDDTHATGLMRDLVNKGLVAEESLPRRRGQRWGLDYLFLAITDKGTSLVNETAPVDPDIDDERVVEE